MMVLGTDQPRPLDVTSRTKRSRQHPESLDHEPQGFVDVSRRNVQIEDGSHSVGSLEVISIYLTRKDRLGDGFGQSLGIQLPTGILEIELNGHAGQIEVLGNRSHAHAMRNELKTRLLSLSEWLSALRCAEHLAYLV